MPRDHSGSNIERSPYFGALQDIIDGLFPQRSDVDPTDAAAVAEAMAAEILNPTKVRRLDVVIAAESADLPDDLMGLVKLLPPGDYTREALCTQLNSAIGGHAWGQVYGTVV